MYEGVVTKTLHEYLSDFWNVLDWTNLIVRLAESGVVTAVQLFILSIFWRMQFVYLAYEEAPRVRGHNAGGPFHSCRCRRINTMWLWSRRPR